jgi:hypothetical protein
MTSRRRAACLTTALVALTAHSAAAAGLTLAWDANKETGIAGYVVKYGDQPRAYHATLDVGLATTVKVEGLVSGRPYYFTILAYAADGSASVLATELAAIAGVAAPGPAAGKSDAFARFLAPLDGARQVTSAQIFQWAPVAGAQAYRLEIGTRAGLSDVVNSGETQRTWWSTRALPADTRLYARLATKREGVWRAQAIEFVTAPTAVLVYPYAGASDTSADEIFSWTGVTGAQAYRLDVGTTPGGSDLVESGDTLATTFAVTGLQPGQTLYARVSTRMDDVWQVDAVTFTTAFAARLTRPTAGDGSDLGQGLAWTTILGAEAYALRLGTTPGSDDLLNSGEVQTQTLETPALPAGTPIYARLSTRHGGEWRQQELSFTVAGAALLVPAGDGGTTGAAAGLLTWTPITNADAYSVSIGTEPGAQDLASTGEIQSTSYLMNTLPAGRTVYVSLWTKADGLWNGTAATFTTK